MKVVTLIKMCLNEAYSTAWVGRYLSDMFPIKNGLKKEDVLLSLFSNFALKYAIRRVQVNQGSWKLNGTHLFLVYADDAYIHTIYNIHIHTTNIHTIKKTWML